MGLAPYHSQMCMGLVSARPSTFRLGCTSSPIKHGSNELPDLLPLSLATAKPIWAWVCRLVAFRLGRMPSPFEYGHINSSTLGFAIC